MDFNNNAEIGARSHGTVPKENFVSVGQPPPQKLFSSGSSSEEMSSDELTPDDDIYLHPIPGSRNGHFLETVSRKFWIFFQFFWNFWNFSILKFIFFVSTETAPLKEKKKFFIMKQCKISIIRVTCPLMVIIVMMTGIITGLALNSHEPVKPLVVSFQGNVLVQSGQSTV